MTDKEMQNFNWVTARHACSVDKMFLKLRLDIESEVNTRELLKPEKADYKFVFSSNGNKFAVSRNSGISHNWLQLIANFSCDGKQISVSDESGKPTFSATVTLSDDGICRFKIDGDDCEPWQLRKRALERVFFEGL